MTIEQVANAFRERGVEDAGVGDFRAIQGVRARPVWMAVSRRRARAAAWKSSLSGKSRRWIVATFGVFLAAPFGALTGIEIGGAFSGDLKADEGNRPGVGRLGFPESAICVERLKGFAQPLESARMY